jgi:hypothetical protein
VFPKINWLTKAKFEQALDDLKQKKATRIIQPYLLNIADDTAQHKNFLKLHEVDKRIYIGKTIPKSGNILTNHNHNQQEGNHQNQILPFENTETIGNVYKSDEKTAGGKWCMKVTHNGYVFEVTDEFLVLCIDDPDSFYWSSNVDAATNNSTNQGSGAEMMHYFQFNIKEIPMFALRASVDKERCEYNYIGRTVEDEASRCKRPKFFSNGWYHIGDQVPQMFGKVKKSYKLLFAPTKTMELGFDQFETLCLKASPASLQELCRSAIRSNLNYSQKKIKSLKARRLVPKSLVNFLKYPSFLTVGEYLLKTEKLVSDDDRIEISLDRTTGNLIIKRHLLDEHINTSNSDNNSDVCECEESNFSTQKVIAYNVDAVWLHRFHTVFYDNKNSQVKPIHLIYDNLVNYKFSFDFERGEPILVQTL